MRSGKFDTPGGFCWVVLLAMAAMTVLQAAPAAALEYRKCAVKITVIGSGLAETEVEGARFVVWGRARLASFTWKAINKRALACGLGLVQGDTDTIHPRCRANESALNNSGAIGSGVTGLNTSRVKRALKATICDGHVRPRDGVRTFYDTREIDGLTAYVKPLGPSKACLSQRIIQPSYVKLHCNRDGEDAGSEWFFKN